MPSLFGTSVAGPQFVMEYRSISQPQIELLIPSYADRPPTRLGYAWIIARENSDFVRQRVLQHGPIYGPGIFRQFPNTYGFEGFQYGWQVNWNLGDLPFEVYYE